MNDLAEKLKKAIKDLDDWAYWAGSEESMALDVDAVLDVMKDALDQIRRQ